MQVILRQLGDCNIRRAEPSDLISVMEINLKTLPEHYSDYFYESLLAEIPEAFIVAEIGGKHVGYIMCKTEFGFSNFKKLGFVKKGHVVSTVDGFGNLFIADSGNNRIRKVNAETGIITTLAGDGLPGFSGDGGQATAAQLSFPVDVAVDDFGNLFIADTVNNLIRMVAAGTGIIATVAGNGNFGGSGDGGPATAAELRGPFGVAVDAVGNLFIADFGNDRIRAVRGPIGDVVVGVSAPTRSPIFN